MCDLGAMCLSILITVSACKRNGKEDDDDTIKYVQQEINIRERFMNKSQMRWNERKGTPTLPQVVAITHNRSKVHEKETEMHFRIQDRKMQLFNA